ncbi:hypothetical protein MKEN_00745700 [Mycena kentingensis (nom. inval.)]|nr:hypothetical protein MKEN_00745700 [Mycena kentingensis (nom. inval.)]
MPRAGDIPVQLIGIASLWPTTVLYGVNVVMFMICFTSLVRKQRRREKKAPWFLLGATSLQFLLCTAHIICVFGAAANAFSTVLPSESSAKLVQVWISSLGKWTTTQQLMYAINNLVGDLILIWRLYVLYNNSWLICVVPICLALAQIGCNLYSIGMTFAHPAVIVASLTTGRRNAFAQVVVAGFALMAATQVLVTVLLAARIYFVTRHLDKPSRGYSSVLWLLVESGSAMAIVDILWIAVWKQGYSGMAQMILAILGQLSALVPFAIITRVSLRLAFDGQTQGSAYMESGNFSTTKPGVQSSGTLQFRARTPSHDRSTTTMERSELETETEVESGTSPRRPMYKEKEGV